MKTFYFTDLETGEEFFVEAKDKYEAVEIAREYFEVPSFNGEVPTEWAEMMGLDTYQKGE